MLWWIGGALAFLLSAAWAISISVAVSRGEKWASGLASVPAYAFHFGTGVLALWLLMRAVG